tara:strand:+ start:459 stop:2336 length:1878 start_codon:yes stop_codon:yes gene_type:complete
MVTKIYNFSNRNKFIIALLLLHFLGILFFYNATNFLVSKSPIYNYDYPYHLYNCYEVKHYYSIGKSWGYNPFFLAGYPSGVTLDSDFLQLVCSLFPLSGQIVVIKIWVILILLSLPLLIYWSSLNFGFGKKISIISSLILLIYLYNDYFINTVIYYGMFNFILASGLSLFFLSLIFKYIQGGRKRILIPLFIFLPLFALVHSSVLLFFLIPLLILSFVYFKRLSLGGKLTILALASVVFLPVLLWVILPFYKQIAPYIIYKADHYLQIYDLREVLNDFYFSFKKNNFGIQYIKSFILLSGFLGILSLLKKSKLFFVFLIMFLFLFSVVYFHNIVIPLNFFANFQPYKFIIPLVFFSIIPAAYFIQILTKKNSNNYFNYFKRALFSLIAFFIIFNVIEIHSGQFPRYRLTVVPPANYLNLVEWAKKNTSPNERIMMESNLLMKEIFDKPSIVKGLFSKETKRELLTAPHNYSVLKHSFSSFTRKEIFGKRWDEINDEKLVSYLNLYNVGWIVVSSEEAKKNIAKKYKKNLFDRKIEFDNFSIYRVKNNNRSFIIGGTGEITADFNKIKIQNLQSDKKDVVLKYHWHPTLKSKPKLELEPVYLLDMPVPFVKIVEPSVSEIEIYNSY